MILMNNIKDHKLLKAQEIVISINPNIMKMTEMILLLHQCTKEYKISKKSIKIPIINILLELKIFDINTKTIIFIY